MTDVIIRKKQVYTIASDVTLLAHQSGAVFNVSKAAARTITMPSPVGLNGCEFTFISGAVAAFVASIVCGNNLAKGVLMNSAASAAPNANGTVTFTATSVQGDILKFISDGAVWNVLGASRVAAGLA